MKTRTRRLLTLLLIAAMTMSLMVPALAVNTAQSETPYTYDAGDYTFGKISHADKAPGTPDGIVDYTGDGTVAVTGTVTGADGQVRWKADPYGTYAQLRPDTASRLYDVSGFRWHDDVWRERRRETPLTDGPLNIYEVHPGSWRRDEDGGFLNYRQLADRCQFSLLPPQIRG